MIIIFAADYFHPINSKVKVASQGVTAVIDCPSFVVVIQEEVWFETSFILQELPDWSTCRGLVLPYKGLQYFQAFVDFNTCSSNVVLIRRIIDPEFGLAYRDRA